MSRQQVSFSLIVMACAFPLLGMSDCQTSPSEPSCAGEGGSCGAQQVQVCISKCRSEAPIIDADDIPLEHQLCVTDGHVCNDVLFSKAEYETRRLAAGSPPGAPPQADISGVYVCDGRFECVAFSSSNPAFDVYGRCRWRETLSGGPDLYPYCGTGQWFNAARGWNEGFAQGDEVCPLGLYCRDVDGVQSSYVCPDWVTDLSGLWDTVVPASSIPFQETLPGGATEVRLLLPTPQNLPSLCSTPQREGDRCLGDLADIDDPDPSIAQRARCAPCEVGTRCVDLDLDGVPHCARECSSDADCACSQGPGSCGPDGFCGERPATCRPNRTECDLAAPQVDCCDAAASCWLNGITERYECAVPDGGPCAETSQCGVGSICMAGTCHRVGVDCLAQQELTGGGAVCCDDGDRAEFEARSVQPWSEPPIAPASPEVGAIGETWCLRVDPSRGTACWDGGVFVVRNRGTYCATCGDGICTSAAEAAAGLALPYDETPGGGQACPEDCDLVPNDAIVPVCGDGTCAAGETIASCYHDCGAICGNGACEPSELAITCPEDCP
ncbi:MAG: hypothetical protein ACFCGT_27775 [Sandaracinaceae bacterium]